MNKTNLLTKLLLLCLCVVGSVSSAWADDTYYYGCTTLSDGALTNNPSTVQFIKAGTTLSSSTDLSWSATPSTGGIYYNSSDLSSTELAKSSNWSSSSS